MSFLQKIKYILLLLPLIAAQSCSSDDFVGPDLPSEPEVAGYLQLAVSTSGSSAYSRANPSGGENGDGPEYGRFNENKIHNLTIFVYQDYGAGLDGDYRFVWKKYVDENIIGADKPDSPFFDLSYMVKIPLNAEDIGSLRLATGATLRAIVVANCREDLSLHNSTSALRRLTNYGSAWTGATPAEADNFVMSNAFNGAKHSSRDGRVTVTGAGTNDATIYNCQVNLERVAARIDLKVKMENIDGDGRGGLLYGVKNTGHKVRLTNIIPVNLMNNKSYLIKHVSSKIGTPEELRNDNFLAAGNEDLDNGIPANYVITPDFFEKPATNTTLNYTNTARSLRVKPDSELAGLNPLSSANYDFIQNAYMFDGAADDERTIILTYANENTCHSSVQEIHDANGYTVYPSDYLTGLLIRAQYYPDKVYTTGDVSVGSPKEDYVEGNTFYMFRRLAIEGVNEAGNLYFKTESALNAYVAANTEGMTEGIDYRTETYTGGICYYNVWIRHANVDGVDNIPMMYGIVRNNIYRLSLTFSNIGMPEPDIQEPHKLIDFVIDVVPWVFEAKVHIPVESVE